MTDKAKSTTLHQEVAELSAKMVPGIKVDAKTATATAVETLYKDNLPEGVTMDTVKKLSDYNTSFVAAGAHAFGTVATEAAKGHKKLEKVSIDIPMGVKDNVSYTFDRVLVIPNRFGTGEDVTKYGNIKTTYEVRAGKAGAQLKAARAAINELAFAALAK
jgi:hypothetical protein